MAEIHSIKDPAQTSVEHEIYCAGQGYGTCNTNWEVGGGNTMMVAMTGYKLVKGFLAVRFSYEVPANASMNVNSCGSAPIKFNGVAIASGLIMSGFIVLFYYDGSAYNVVNIHDGYKLVTSLSSGSTHSQYPSAKCVYDLIGDIETLLAAI